MKRKGAFYALESIAASLLLAYYLYKIITISFPVTAPIEKQILYKDELFTYLTALEDIESFKNLIFYTENKDDIKRFFDYFISSQGYYQLYFLHLPPKSPVIGVYVEPQYVYKTHYINTSYAKDEECINTYLSNFAFFGDLTAKKIKCKEAIVLGHRALYVIIDERPAAYLKSLIVDLNDNGIYEDPPNDGLYAIGSFITELSSKNKWYYIQDLPEENNTYYLYTLTDRKKALFDHIVKTNQIGKLKIFPLIKFYTNTTKTFEGYDALIIFNYLPSGNANEDMLWSKYVKYYKGGGNLLIIAPLNNSFKLNELGIYNQTDAGYYVRVPSHSISFEEGVSGGLYKKYLINTLFHEITNLTLEFITFPLSYLSSECKYEGLNYSAYRTFYINYSASNFTCILGKLGSSYAIYIDEDGDCNFTEEKEIIKGEEFLLNTTYFKFIDFDEGNNKIILRYVNGTTVYANVLPTEYLIYPEDLIGSTLLKYYNSEVLLNNSYKVYDIIKSQLREVSPNTWKASIYIDDLYTVYISENSNGDKYLYFENNPTQKYLINQCIFIKNELYQWDIQFGNELILKLIYRPSVPAALRIGNDNGGDLIVLNLDLVGKPYQEYYNLLLALLLDEMRNNEIEINNAMLTRESSGWVMYSYKLEDRNQITFKVRRYI